MRKYITEKVGILELFQIIFAMLIVCLGFYSSGIDASWNKEVEKRGLQVCTDINNEIYKKDPSILLESECADILDIKDKDSCAEIIKEEYLTLPKDPFDVPKGITLTPEELEEFVKRNMRRRQASELACLIIITCIGIILVGHLLVTSFAKNIEFRTKWNAALQGIVLFAAGFASMLLRISANAIDNKYIIFSKEVRMCDTLRFCDRMVSTHPEVPQSVEFIIDNALEGRYACQMVHVKEAISILLMFIIGTCVAMILLAMDLNSEYEQESEEEEINLTERQTSNNLVNLVEDHSVTFESVHDTNDESGTDVPAMETLSVHKKAPHRGRSSFAVLSEFLHHHA